MDVLVTCHVYKRKYKLQIKWVLKLARLSCENCYRLESSDRYCLKKRPSLSPQGEYIKWYKLPDKCFFFSWAIASFV